mmetsp:Transcript_7691/g.34316  ORF Transcript_7691/g.34316 Transcript_7691/m.34316 type:complete len:243 (+) Transcript_7691:2157-2885(+)
MLGPGERLALIQRLDRHRWIRVPWNRHEGVPFRPLGPAAGLGLHRHVHARDLKVRAEEFGDELSIAVVAQEPDVDLRFRSVRGWLGLLLDDGFLGFGFGFGFGFGSLVVVVVLVVGGAMGGDLFVEEEVVHRPRLVVVLRILRRCRLLRLLRGGRLGSLGLLRGGRLLGLGRWLGRWFGRGFIRRSFGRLNFGDQFILLPGRVRTFGLEDGAKVRNLQLLQVLRLVARGRRRHRDGSSVRVP